MAADESISIVRAAAADITSLAPLLDQYRVFYKQEANLQAATSFLEERFDQKESVVFMAWYGKEAVGFTQLYPTFSSVSLQASFILNDLYVVPSHRREGIANKLLAAAQEFCISRGFKGLSLETATNNPAQKLYEQMGWKKDTDYYHYYWSAPMP